MKSKKDSKKESKKGIRFDNELLRETLSWIDTIDNGNTNDNITNNDNDDININDLDLMIAPIWAIPPQRPSRTVDSLIERTNRTMTSYLFRSDDDSDNENNTIKNITKRMILRMRLSIKKWMKYNLIQNYQKEALIKG